MPPKASFRSVCMVAETVPEALNSSKNRLKIYTWESRRWINGQGKEFCLTVAQLELQLILPLPLLQRKSSLVTQTLKISVEKVIFFIPALTYEVPLDEWNDNVSVMWCHYKMDQMDQTSGHPSMLVLVSRVPTLDFKEECCDRSVPPHTPPHIWSFLKTTQFLTCVIVPSFFLKSKLVCCWFMDSDQTPSGVFAPCICFTERLGLIRIKI